MGIPSLPIPRLTEEELCRFWSSVSQTKTCWNWTSERNNTERGYGRIFIRGRLYYAHRVSYALHHEYDISIALLVCHSCDNPRCVNPSHLFLGTQQDNIDDMISKGRQNTGVSYGDNNGSRKHPESLKRGEDHALAKLTEADIRLIRRLSNNGNSGCSIARRLGVHKKTVYKVIKGVAWKHV